VLGATLAEISEEQQKLTLNDISGKQLEKDIITQLNLQDCDTLKSRFPGDYTVGALLEMASLGLLDYLKQEKVETDLKEDVASDLFRFTETEIMLPAVIDKEDVKSSSVRFAKAAAALLNLKIKRSKLSCSYSQEEKSVMIKLCSMLFGKSFQLTGFRRPDMTFKKLWLSAQDGQNPNFELLKTILFECPRIKNMRKLIVAAFKMQPKNINSQLVKLIQEAKTENLAQYLIKERSLYKEVPLKKIFYSFTKDEIASYPILKILLDLDSKKKKVKMKLFDKENEDQLQFLRKLKAEYDKLSREFRDLVFKRIKALREARATSKNNIFIDNIIDKLPNDAGSLALKIIMKDGFTEKERRNLISSINGKFIFLTMKVHKECKLLLESSDFQIVGNIETTNDQRGLVSNFNLDGLKGLLN
jgi:hypothetical protein